MTIFAENKITREIYPCNSDKAIADVCSQLNVSKSEAIYILHNATIENPLYLKDCNMWSD